MTQISASTNEKQLLHFLLDDPLKILTIRNLFITQEGKDLFKVIETLSTRGAELSDENIIGEGNRVNPALNSELLSLIRQTSYDPKAWKHYVQLQKESYAEDRLEGKVLPAVTQNILKKGHLDIEGLKLISQDLQDCIALAEETETEDTLLTTEQLFKGYKEVIEDRITGETFYTTGCSHLDSALPRGFAPGEITTLFGSTGVGKSTFALYLVNRLVNRRVPVIYMTLEMSRTATMDRWMASRLRIPMNQLAGTPSEPVEDYISDMVRREEEKLKDNKMFRMVDKSSLSADDVGRLIRKFQSEVGCQYVVVFLDLATMLKELSGGEPRDYEKGMDALHRAAKDTGTHLVLVVQAVQKHLEDHRPSSVEGVDVFRPSLASIKNSSAIAERSRAVISVFRPKYYATRFFPENPEVQKMDDVVEVQVLKSSSGAVGGRVRYLHNEGMFRLVALTDDFAKKELEFDLPIVVEDSQK